MYPRQKPRAHSGLRVITSPLRFLLDPFRLDLRSGDRCSESWPWPQAQDQPFGFYRVSSPGASLKGLDLTGAESEMRAGNKKIGWSSGAKISLILVQPSSGRCPDPTKRAQVFTDGAVWQGRGGDHVKEHPTSDVSNCPAKLNLGV